MIWDYTLRKRLYDELCRKLEKFKEDDWLGFWESKSRKEPRGDTAKWNKYLDDLGCSRIIRTKLTGWEYEDEHTTRNVLAKKKSLWKSMNVPGFVHLSNPMWPGDFNNNEHIIRIPREIADKAIVLGGLP